MKLQMLALAIIFTQLLACKTVSPSRQASSTSASEVREDGRVFLGFCRLTPLECANSCPHLHECIGGVENRKLCKGRADNSDDDVFPCWGFVRQAPSGPDPARGPWSDASCEPTVPECIRKCHGNYFSEVDAIKCPVNAGSDYAPIACYCKQ